MTVFLVASVVFFSRKACGSMLVNYVLISISMIEKLLGCIQQTRELLLAGLLLHLKTVHFFVFANGLR